MKKLILATTAGIGLLALAACNEGGDGQQPPPAPEGAAQGLAD